MKYYPYKLYQFCDDLQPEDRATVTKEQALKYLEQMVYIRRIETVAGNLYKSKIVRGFCHLYTGQEAVAVGIKAAMRKQDSVITAYRAHGWTYLMGVPPIGILAELTGRMKGCSKGKGGSMHMFAPNYYGGNGIVGAQVPLGAGVALAAQYSGNGGVCITCYGDGAANQGQVFEAYNMAYLWKLPCIFVCENNNYAMGTSASRGTMNTDFFTRGDVIPGIWVDGMDILTVRGAAEFAIDYALNHGPIVFEAHTYRYSGHSMSDPGTSYRTRDEIEEIRKSKDPIATFKQQMIAAGIFTEEETKDLETKIKNEIQKVSEEAQSDKELELKHLWSDVYANNLTPKIRGILDFDLTHEEFGKPFIPPGKLDHQPKQDGKSSKEEKSTKEAKPTKEEKSAKEAKPTKEEKSAKEAKPTKEEKSTKEAKPSKEEKSTKEAKSSKEEKSTEKKPKEDDW